MRRNTDNHGKWGQMRHYLPIFLFLWVALFGDVMTLQAQTDSKFVSGVVMDKKLGETIPGVAVAIWQNGQLV